MSAHWPLGRGRYERCLAHAAVAAAIGCGALVTTGLGSAPGSFEEMAGPHRFWGLVMFLAAAFSIPVLLLHSPGALRMLLPMPIDGAGLHHMLRLDRRVGCRILPYAFGIAALLPWDPRGLAWTVSSVFFACMLLRFFLPLISLAAFRLRVLLVPWGHLIVWGAAAGTICGLWTGWPSRGNALAGMPFLTGPGRPDIWIAAGIVLIALTRPLRRWCARAMIPQYRWAQLRNLAFPVTGERRSKPRRMMLELVKLGAAYRRFLFLVQEASGLHRLRDWLKAAAVWAASVAGLLLLPWSWPMGPGSHMLVTVGACLIVLAWTCIRNIRIETGPAPALEGFALPVGHLEMLLARAVLLSKLFLVTGGIVMMANGSIRSGEPEGARRIVSVMLTNLVQVWLIALGFLAGISSGMAVFRRAKRGRWAGVYIAVNGGIALLAITAVIGLAFQDVLPSEQRWGPAMPTGMIAGSVIGAHLSLEHRQSAGVEAFVTALPRSLFEMLGWLLPCALLICALDMFIRTCRGRSDPRYRTGFQVCTEPERFFSPAAEVE